MNTLNRLSERTYPNGTSDVFQYDQAGNLVGTTNPYIAYYYSYDANNRLTGVTSYNLAQIFNIEYQYDITGNRKTMTFKEGTSIPKVINYEYNINNQMTKITADMGSFTFAYDALGRRIKRTLPNDSYTTYAYDQLSRLTGMTHINAFNQTIDSFGYTYDNVGNRLTKSDSNKTISYNYDPIYRLTKVSPSRRTTAQLPEDIVNHHSEAYGYDPVGNRQTGPDKFDAYTYNNANEMLTYSGHPNKGNNYEYDLNGNLIKKIETIQGNAKLITSYTYDDENRLIYVTIAKRAKIKEISFAYDPFGRRISKTIEKDELNDDSSTNKKDYPLTTFYIYDEQNIIAEYDQTGKQTATYIHGPNIDEPLAADINNTRIYYHADGLGSITTLTNHMGHKVQQYDYDSFGNIKSTPYWIKQPYTYTAREFDYETGLYYYRARYYDPKVGRFVTKDPIGFNEGEYNLFIYVGNNPQNYTDPTGLAKMCCRLLDSVIFGKVARKRHCYIIADNGIRYGLYPQNGKGVPRINDPRDVGGACYDCPCLCSSDDQNQCLKDAHNSYPVGTYSSLGPNSNTYAGTLAKSCCKGGIPSGVHDAPGINSNPPTK